MRLAFLAAGAGGMYCGSCLHDNTLARTLIGMGHEVALVPAYTPMRVDEESVAIDRVFYGAVNVYLQQKYKLFRKTPRWLDRLLDRPGLLNWVSNHLAGTTDAHQLGALAYAVLQGEEGPAAKELDRLVRWLAFEYKPDAVQITNSLLLGLAHRIREEVEVPVAVQVHGEDLFLDELEEPWRERVVAEMRHRAGEIDVFIAPSRYYADHMAELLGVPGEKMRVVPLGIDLAVHRDGRGSAADDGCAEEDDPADRRAEAPDRVTLGYLARVAPEKGLRPLIEAFRLLVDHPGGDRFRLRVAGYLGAKDKAYHDAIVRDVAAWGLAEQVEFVGEVDLDGKRAFLDSLDLLSVPTVFPEPKGIFALEAMAHCVPVVLPRHGSFPEMIEATGGGVLVEPGSAPALARALGELAADPARRQELGCAGARAVLERHSAEVMARETVALWSGLGVA